MSVEDVALTPELDRDYGCQEVRHVANTMEVLYKVVRDANFAFFAGDVETAYAVLTDTLRLFQVSEDKRVLSLYLLSREPTQACAFVIIAPALGQPKSYRCQQQ
jgi:hypothetical protein